MSPFRNILLLGMVLIFLGRDILGQTPAASSRLAIISTADTADLAALVTEELSGKPEVEVVERDELARIGDERKVQQLASRDALAFGKLVGADGLLFLDQGPGGIHIRFTAVGLGYALFDDQMGAGADLSPLARSVSHRIANYLPKLRLDPAKAIPVSVLNLRADYATPESTEIERNLTLLLESRLAAVPEYVVLERRHAWPLGFERSLCLESPALRLGAQVVDGRFSLQMAQSGREIVVQLRVRSQGDRETSVEIRAPEGDLYGLVEKMAVEIGPEMENSPAVAAWDSQREAREYFMEGLWGWRNNADAAALEALDSAELLGEKTPDLIPLRIDVLLHKARRGLERKAPDAPSPDEIVDDVLRAISDATRYETENLQSKLERLAWQQYPDVRTAQIKENLANFATDLLRELESCNAPRADELRMALRAITGYDPAHGRLGMLDYSDPLNVLVDSQDQWDLTLEEQLARYRLLCTLPHQYIPPQLLTGRGEGFCRRFLKTPSEQKSAYQRFVRTLKNDPQGRLAYDLIMSCSPNDTEADAAYSRYWTAMWNRREALASQKVQVQEWTSSRPVPEERRRKHAQEMIPLLRYYLTHVNNYRHWEYSWDILWQPEEWSESDAAAIWKEFLAFKQRAVADRRARGYNPLNLSRFEEAFQKKFPRMANAREDGQKISSLTVRRFWHPWLMSDSSRFPTTINQAQSAGGALWLRAWVSGPGPTSAAIFRVRFPDFQTDRIPLPEPLQAQFLSVGSESAFLGYFSFSATSAKQRMGRLDLKTLQWETRDFEEDFQNFTSIEDTLFVGLRGGIGRYDWKTSTFTLLASSRRRPAQNQLDDCGPYRVVNIFAGPEGRPSVTVTGGTYYLREEPGNWSKVFDASPWMGSITDQGKTLIFSRRGEVVLIDPSRREPEYLMTPREPVYRNAAQIGRASVREWPPWKMQAIWDAPQTEYLDGPLWADRNHLACLLPPHDQVSFPELLWYDRMLGRDPGRIPLRLELPRTARDILLSAAEDQKTGKSLVESMEHPDRNDIVQLSGGESGICLVNRNGGVWFVPFADINAFLKDQAGKISSSALAAMDTAKIPRKEDDVESRVIGDMIDPARAEDSFR